MGVIINRWSLSDESNRQLTILVEVCARFTHTVAKSIPIPTEAGALNTLITLLLAMQAKLQVQCSKKKTLTIHSKPHAISQKVSAIVKHISLHKDNRLVPAANESRSQCI